MHQLTLRLPDELATAVAREAAAEGTSVNRFICRAVEAMVSPDTIDDDLLRLRARLRAAGLIVSDPPPAPDNLPTEQELAEARRQAGQGKPLSEYVSEGRR